MTAKAERQRLVMEHRQRIHARERARKRAEHFWIFARAVTLAFALLGAGFLCLAVGWTSWHEWWQRILAYAACGGVAYGGCEFARIRLARRRLMREIAGDR